MQTPLLPTNMQVLAKAARGPGLSLETRKVPECGPEEVLIRMLQTGICGTDGGIYLDNEWSKATVAEGRIIGHEGVGEIVQIGSEVPEGRFRLSDRVVFEAHRFCSDCHACNRRNFHTCEHVRGAGYHEDGTFAEYMARDWRYAIVVPSYITTRTASFLDILGNAVHAVRRIGVEDRDVLLIGAGPAGLGAIQAARQLGARSVTVSDIHNHKLAIARDLGADRTYNIRAEALPENAFDAVIEMSGKRDGRNDAMRCVCSGGRVGVFGLCGDDIVLRDWDDLIKTELMLMGMYGRSVDPDELGHCQPRPGVSDCSWTAMFKMLHSGDLNPDPIVSEVVPLAEWERGVQAVADGETTKVIIEWWRDN